MSPAKALGRLLRAPSACRPSSRSGRAARSCPARCDHTSLARPEMPSPSLSSGSARARICSSGMASSRPTPIIGGATRGDSIVCGCSGPYLRPSMRVGRMAQADDGAVGERHRLLLIVDAHVAFVVEALDGDVLQLLAVGRLVDGVDAMLGEEALLLVVLRRDRQAQEHRFRSVRGKVRCRRMAASVLQVAALAGARIVQRAETVGAGRRRRRRDPQLAEDGVADLEVGFAFKADAVREMRERFARVDAVLRRGAAARVLFARLVGDQRRLGGAHRQRGEAGHRQPRDEEQRPGRQGGLVGGAWACALIG